MLSGPVIAFTLVLYVVAVWGGSFVNNGPGDVLILCWGEEQYPFGLGQTVAAVWCVGMVEVLLLTLLLCQQEVPDVLHVNRG